MGVAGVGKSTIAAALATRLGSLFVEGDALHPPENVAKMTSGEPLDDADRAPWLDAVAAVLAGTEDVVVTCSALRRAYRDRLRAAAPDALFLHVEAPTEVLEQRLVGRQGHFMQASMLSSQLATLEPLQPDERGLVVDGSRPLDAVVDDVERQLASGQGMIPNHLPM